MIPSETSPSPAPRGKTINLRVTIDTDSIPLTHGDPGDINHPASIGQDQGSMVVTASQGVKNQGTGHVFIEACPDDTIHFFISSGSNNFEQAVLLESVRHIGGDGLLKDFTSQVLERAGIVPSSQTEVLPARIVQQQFRFFHCIVVGAGTGSYDLVFALYGRDEEAQPRLIGQYRWAMQLTIVQPKGRSRE